MSLSTEPPQPSVSERRGQHLAPLQTNFSRPTSQILNVAPPVSQRPRPSDYDNSKAERVPLQSEHVKRQSSRSSLRNIFSREKPARKSADKRLSGIEESLDTVSQVPGKEATPLSPTPEEACDTPRATADSTSTPPTPHQPSNPPRSKLQAKHRAKTDSEDPLPAEDVAWKPPPLFKAYPQGLKHVTLPAPILSGDSIMRLHATFKARGASLHDDEQQARKPANEEPSEEITSRKKKLDKEKQKYSRALSDNIEKGEWTQKVYIIATTGYILQYAGDGKHDRLPEKMLLLGPKSVAFASDAIPGKHWVLQVSQGSEEDSSTIYTESSRPILSRFGFHRPHARRLARNLLLVFNDPEEMSSWLLAVRAQIEARGGKKYVTEKVDDAGMETQLRSSQSMRQMVKKDPNRFSAVYLQPRQSMNFEDRDSSVGEQSRRSSYISVHRRSMVMHQPPESRGSVSTAQTEVPEEPGRFYAALGSPPIPDGSVISESASIIGPTSPTLSTPRKRQSMFLPQGRSVEAAEIPRAQSTVPEALVRSASPPAPNFSVPLFSKRFAARQDVPHAPQLSSIHGDNHPDDVSIDTLSMFSSPPQSPNREGFHGTMDTREPRRPLDRRVQIKRPLRTSTSEDALPSASQARDRSRLRYSHLPEHITMLPGTSNLRRSVPVKPIGHTAASHHPTPLAKVVNTPNRREPSNRSDPPSRPSSIVSARRKSLTGLAAGPPSAPPPNVPLPKIPSAFIEPSPQSGWPEHSSSMSTVDGAGKPMHNMTSVSANGHGPRPIRNIVPQPMHNQSEHDSNFF